MASRAPLNRQVTVTVALIGALVLAGCSGNDTIESVDVTTTPTSAVEPTTTPTEATAPTTSPATTPATTPDTTPAITTDSTIAAETTTPLPATTTATPAITAADLTLSAAGLLPFVFGDTDAAVLAGLAEALGTPIFDRAQTYPDPADDGTYLDATGEEGFTDPIGRTVCFANDLCAHFGGPTTDSLTFTGWRLDGDGAPQITTVRGVTVGSLWSDHLANLEVGEGGCYTNGFGYTEGINLGLLSINEPFATFDNDGNYITNMPDPANVSVLTMTAGDVPYFIYEDC